MGCIFSLFTVPKDNINMYATKALVIANFKSHLKFANEIMKDIYEIYLFESIDIFSQELHNHNIYEYDMFCLIYDESISIINFIDIAHTINELYPYSNIICINRSNVKFSEIQRSIFYNYFYGLIS